MTGLALVPRRFDAVPTRAGVHAWLAGYPADVVAQLPVDDRVAAVRTLLSGAVDAQDAAAAEQLLKGIGSPADAVVVRHALKSLPATIGDPAVPTEVTCRIGPAS